MNIFKLNLSRLKTGIRKNALNYPIDHNIINQLETSEKDLVTSDTPIVKGRPGEKDAENWLEPRKTEQIKSLTVIQEQSLEHHQVIFERYNSMISRLLLDMAAAAKWNRIGSRARLLSKKGEAINGWGWVIYRIHSSGEAILPENPTPQNYTLFNFWQVGFDCGIKPNQEPDLSMWDLYAIDTLNDIERLMIGEVEKWLKEQLYQMFKNGCMWVALPDLIDEKGKSRKPTIQDALYTYSMISFGRNYDPYQTEKHFYDRPPLNNQFVPGYFKR